METSDAVVWTREYEQVSAAGRLLRNPSLGCFAAPWVMHSNRPTRCDFTTLPVWPLVKPRPLASGGSSMRRIVAVTLVMGLLAGACTGSASDPPGGTTTSTTIATTPVSPTTPETTTTTSEPAELKPYGGTLEVFSGPFGVKRSLNPYLLVETLSEVIRAAVAEEASWRVWRLSMVTRGSWSLIW